MLDKDLKVLNRNQHLIMDKLLDIKATLSSNEDESNNKHEAAAEPTKHRE